MNNKNCKGEKSMSLDVYDRRHELIENAKFSTALKIKDKLKLSYSDAVMVMDCIAYSFYDGSDSADTLVKMCSINELEILAVLNKENEFVEEYENKQIVKIDCMWD
jgi:hypothetical protein